ncbi:antitoxin [Streptomyces sp. NPDC005925]|uniref:antitoxin n=1 Tax=Streptomyces sp. NPDC005925 TaxID=3157172 RepID=UPI0033D143FD
MGLMENLKGKLGPAKGKASGLAQQHGDKIQSGIDKAAKAVDERTKGKYSKGIRSGSGKAKEAMDRLAHHEGPQDGTGGPGAPGGTGGTTPPAGPPPTS